MKKFDIENKIWKYIEKHPYVILFILLTFFSLIIRIFLLKYTSGDYDMFLKPWFNDLKINGGLLALSRNIGNYTPIYMTILSILTYIPVDSLISIKIVSLIFEYLGGIYLIKIVLELFKNNKNSKRIALIIYGIYLILPTIILNSSYWAQSDSIYTSFVLISLYYLIKNDFIKGMIFWSLAFSFKFQAIFIFPLYVLLYFSNRKIRFKNFLIIPLVVFACSIPKVIFSHDFLTGFRIYFNQAGTYDNYLTLNLPNFYSIFLKGYDSSNPNLINTPLKEMSSIGIIITLIIFMIIAFVVINKKIKFNKKSIIDFALWSILICNFFLPQMHERYLFMGDVIALIYWSIHKDKYYIPIIIELISLNGYMYSLFSGFAIDISILSILYLVMLVVYSKNMYVEYFSGDRV